MKKIKEAIFFISILLSTNGIAQNTETNGYKLGVNVSYQYRLLYQTFDFLGAMVSPQITLTKNKHQFEIGPGFYPGHRRYETKIGILGGYKFYPNGFNNRLNTSLIINVPINYAVDDPVSYVPSLLYSYDAIQEVKFIAAYVQAGYGINLKVTERLYIGSDLSLGCGYIFRNTKYIPKGETGIATYNSGYWLIYPVFGLNMGYRF